MLFEYIAFFILIFTSLVGIFSLSRIISEWIFDDSEYMKKLTLLPLYKADERLEMMLKNFLSNTKGKTVIVDMGLDEQTRNTVLRLIKNRNGICLIDGKSIDGIISDML